MKKYTIFSLLLIMSLGWFVLSAAAQQEPFTADQDEWGPAPLEELAPEAAPLPETGAPAEEEAISLDLKQVDVSEALRLLARGTGISFSLPPSITGKVTVSLNNVPFSAALRAILEQVNATYRKEGNLYFIIPASEAEGGVIGLPTVEVPKQLKVLEVRFADAAELAWLFGGSWSGATGGIFGSNNNNNNRNTGIGGRTNSRTNTNTNTNRTSGYSNSGGIGTRGGGSSGGGLGGGMAGGGFGPGGGIGGF